MDENGSNHGLSYRHLGTDRSCPRCAGSVESINHLLFECPPALQVWALSDYSSLPVTSQVHPFIKTWTFCFGREKRWLLWDHNSIHSYGSVGIFGRPGTTNSLMGKTYLQSTLFSTPLLRQNVGEKLTRRRKQMRIRTIPPLHRLRQRPLGCSETQPVKLMHHGSIMAVSVA